MKLTEEIFKKLTIDEAWQLHTQLQEENDELRNIIEDLNRVKDRVHALEVAKAEQDTELLAAKMQLLALKGEVATTNKKQLRDNQYGRLENIEISGIPTEVRQGDLEDTVREVLKKIDVKVGKFDIAACHRLGREKKNTIVRFTNRKRADEVFANVKKMQTAKFDDILSEGARVYINSNLCPEFKNIHYKLKLLKREGKLYGFGSDRRGAYAVTGEGGRRLRIELDSDFADVLGISSEELLQIERRHRRPQQDDLGGFGE